MRKQTVMIDDIISGIDAYVIDGDYWNGWLKPMVKRDDVDAIMAAIVAAHDDADTVAPTYSWDGDTLILTEYDGDDGYTETMAPTMIHGVPCYPLGAGSWTWAQDHRHTYRADIADWWCNDCDTVTDYCNA